MSIGKSNFQASGDFGKPRKGLFARLRQKRRRQDRRSLLQTLEQRHLLAGPSLVGIQPNDGSLLFDGSILNSSPRELVFRFDDNAAIDPATLVGIQVTRAGDDAVFESARATSDLGTNSAVLLEFRAVQPGSAGEGLQIQFTSSSRPGSGAPLVTIAGNVITLDLNSNPARPTQVRDLVALTSGSTANAQLSAILEIFSVSGPTAFALGTAVPAGTAVTLVGANAADAVSDLGTNNTLRVRFVAATSGAVGRNTQIILQRADAGGPANPLVLVNGRQVTVRINSNAGNETTVAQLLTAINSNPEASQIVTALVESGPTTTVLGNRIGFAQTLNLTGATDILVQPGFVGIGNSPNEVVFRFAETLPDDTYQVEIFGTGAQPLANVNGDAFNNGVSTSQRFNINLGPQVLAVVPEPIRRNASNALTPEVGIIEVHFNNDALSVATAQNPAFYQLIFNDDAVTANRQQIVNPTSVSYDRSTNIARLTFAGPLTRLPNGSGGFLTGAARLRIGTSQTIPSAPQNVSVGADPGDAASGAQALGDLSATNTSGIRAVRLQSEVRNVVDYDLEFPGADAAGVRSIRPEDPSRLLRTVPLDYFRQGADSVNGISTIQYDFVSSFQGGTANNPGVTNFNLISEQQKERVREVLSLFSEYLGVQFIERPSGAASSAFFSIAVGELSGADPTVQSEPGGLAVATRDRNLDGVADLVVMDFRDFEQSNDDQFGGEFFRGAMLAIGQLLGYGYADGLPQPVTQSTSFVFNRARGEVALGTNPSALFEILSVNSADTNLIRFVNFAVDPNAGNALPIVGRVGNTITVTLSSNVANPSTAADVVAAINTSPASASQIVATQLRGAATAAIGLTTVATSAELLVSSNEPSYPSVSDIINGQYLYRPDSTDVDLFRFSLRETASVSIQTFAERLLDASLLDTQLRLYREDGATGSFVEVAQNDDYFSNDSLIEMQLSAGNYLIGISASGNNNYNPVIPGTGFGGRSQGNYELRITTSTDNNSGIRDTTNVLLDGDADGTPGGVFDFWFLPSNQNNSIYVDKAATTAGSGTITAPFRDLGAAVAAARPGQTIRVVANGGADGRIETLADNLSYQIGFTNNGVALPDGSTLNVPQGVQLVIDAGVIFKLRGSRVGVGSTAPLLDRSDASIQVLGTPSLVTSSGSLARDSFGEVIPGSVYFTSFNDSSIGNGNTTAVTPAPQPGDWGGIDIRSDLDFVDSNRRNRENEGVFLNHIQFADIRYGGGRVSVDGRQVAVAPVDLALTRATIINSHISLSADAAIAATPDTFAETRFDEPFFQQNGAFTPTVHRVGPEIHGNTIVDNTVNGLFIRVATRTGDILQPLTSQARFDDTDIVHVLTENLQVQGTAGGPIAPSQAPSSLAISIVPSVGGGQVAAGTYVYRLSFSSATSESSASATTVPVTLAATGQIVLSQLPIVPLGGGFTQRRLYRAMVADDGTVSPFVRVATLNGTDTTFTDVAASGTIAIPAETDRLVARLDASLKVDPGTIIKIGGARIDVTFGADFIAEGTANDRVVITSLSDKRFGAGGSFDTNSDPPDVEVTAGDWGGIYVGFTSSASIDNAVIAGGGGTTRVEGGFASFNVLEVHQGTLRLANSRLERNADGRGFIDVNEPERVGRSANASGTVFVRAAQPIISGNDFIDGQGPVATFDINSLVWNEVTDTGRSRGVVDKFASIGNSGPLISQNRLQNNSLNGIEVRGGEVATEVVFDDVDVVHIVRDTIEIPNQHIYGGLRLESDARGSLVIKFQNTAAVAATLTTPAIPARTAGIVAGGSLGTATRQFVDIADRIGGSLQVVGHPDFPVVLTALADDTIGAGFSPLGQQAVDTDNNGIRQTTLTSDTDTVPPPPLLPLGPQFDRTDREVDNGTTIDNDVDPNNLGFFQATPIAGGEVTNISVTGIQVNNGTLLAQQNFQFLNTTLVDIDRVINGILTIQPPPIRLSASTIVQPATLISPDRVRSTGLIDLLVAGDQQLAWTAETFFVNNRASLFTTLNFSTVDGGSFAAPRAGTTNRVANINIINYLDVGIGAAADDVLYSVGTPGASDFRSYIIDGATGVGFSQGGVYTNDGINQINANYLGWAADDATRLLNTINAENSAFTPAGTIDVLLPLNPAFPPFANSTGGRGPGDVGTAFAWSLSINENRSRVTSLVEWLPSDPANPAPITLPPSVDGVGSWNGITIREAANDRNVSSGSESETRLATLGDSNRIPSQSQFLGELAPNPQSGDENRRLGFLIDGSILVASDVDVYSFIGQAGTQVWLDIDRTDLGLDAVVELIDANGVTLVLSDDAIAESRGDINRLVPDAARFSPTNARSLNLLPVAAGSPTSAFQDQYSTNPRDPGMRLVLPGLPGQRNIYHVRVRSSNAADSSNRASLTNPAAVLGGLTTGNYQLQIRLGETDETGGTQIRYADVRFAVNGVQVIGAPLHSPLVGDEFETLGNNETINNAQPLGLFDVAVDLSVTSALGPLASDRLAKSVGGVLSGATDVDWYRFDVNYQNITRDSAALYLSTIFDIDYADGFARSDVAVYVFNGAGQLILVGGDSNIADDQPTGLNGTNNSDLARGSGGTRDPYIGAAELAEGNYFIAVVNQSQVPQVFDQFTAAAALNPLLRLEPIDSVTRIVEDRIDSTGGGTATQPTTLLFNGEASTIPFTLNDVILYTLTGNSVGLANPFTGQSFGNVGPSAGIFNDFAFLPNGELFGYSLPSTLVNQDLDAAYSYFLINSEDGSRTNLGMSGLETFHAALDQMGMRTVVDSDDGLQVEGIAFASNTRGYLVGNRPINRNLPINGVPATVQNAYFQNIIYAFDPQTGAITGLGSPNRQVRTVGTLMIDERADGAGTQIRERGFIETGTGTSQPIGNQLVVPGATRVSSDGTATPTIDDGDAFVLRAGAQALRIELDSGPIINFTPNPATGAFAIDGTVFSLTSPAGTVVYELDTGATITIDAATVLDGASVTIEDSAGTRRVFEFDSNAARINPAAISVPFVVGSSSVVLAQSLAAAISSADFLADGFATPGQGRVGLSGESLTVAPTVAGSGLAVVGAAGSTDPLANIIRVREDFSGAQLAQAVAAATGGAVAGNLVNYRSVTAGNLANLTANGLARQTGTNGVTSGSTSVRFLVSDTPAAIAIRITQAVNGSTTIQSAGVSAASSGSIVTFTGATLNGADGTVDPSFSLASVPPGGIVRGLATIGTALYAVSDLGGLYVVNNPGAAVQGPIGQYVSTATDLLGLNFTGLSAGPQSIPSLLDPFGQPLLFGVTSQGDVYAFDRLGRLQPVFAGGATSVNIGAGQRGIDFSTLDFNLFHVSTRRSADAGHGINATDNGTRRSTNGGASYYFGAETTDADIITNAGTSPFAVARQDGQGVRNTYNFPGGAKGAIESNPFSLEGYSSADLPTLYFNYFLDTEDFNSVDPTSPARDAFRVYAIAENGVEHLLTTNNLALRPSSLFDDEFDDPTLSTNPALAALYADNIDVEVQPTFDSTNSWRQARVSLEDFAGQANLRLRIEFSTGASFGDGTLGLRTVAGASLIDGQTFSVGGQTFEIDLGATLSVPSGNQISTLYSRPTSTAATRVVAIVGGVTYVLNDGNRTINPGEVDVRVLLPGDTPLPTLSSDLIATRLAAAIRTNGVPTALVPLVASVEPNDELSLATQIPATSGNVTISGSSMLESNGDVDLYRVDVPAGATLTVSMAATVAGSLVSNVRLFDTNGNALNPTAVISNTATFVATSAQTVVIGFSSNSNVNYNPLVAGSGDPGVAGTYTATINIAADVRVVQSGSRLQITGGITASGGADGLVVAAGSPGAAGIAVVVDTSMTAEQVAIEVQRAIARQFSSGITSAYPIFGTSITLAGLAVDSAGPFAVSGSRSSDIFGSTGRTRAVNNNFEGLYIDDFIIGFAERGELVTGSVANSVFTTDTSPTLTSPISPTSATVSGSYQLEIRDASEYVNSATASPFRTFDTNTRLSTGVSVRVQPAAAIVDGATFQISDGVSTVTFEFDLESAPGVGTGVSPGRVRIGIPAGGTLAADDDGTVAVAQAIIAAINGPSVRSLIDIAAVAADGVDSLGNPIIDIFGELIILDPSSVLAGVSQLNLRGDQNRDRTEQGIILIENSRFVFNADAGIDLIHDSQSRATGVDQADSTPNVVAYPRNLVELNSQRLVPGVVVQSNILAFNQNAGVRITGLANSTNANTTSAANPVAFDRIVNNTIVGGVISSGTSVDPATFAGIDFPGGAISFADEVVNFTAGTGVSGTFANQAAVIGAPDGPGRGAEPIDGTTTLSLGSGGVLTVQFTDNLLTGSGDARPDLVIFETGEIESVRVEVSRDGVTYFNVGILGGVSNTIDLDAFNFGAQDRFAFVRLTDLRQGTATSGPVGADIDAIGALSTAPTDIYLPGSQGIVVRQNAAPTILNNVVANSQTGVAIDTTSSLTVLGGTTYYRNAINGRDSSVASLGTFADVLPTSLELFVDPTGLVFAPRAGTPIIDASIDSLEDRASLAVVRGAIGLPPSPIIAPTLDINGQLRVDDPTVESPDGVGERVFKDRGAEDRADLVGPRAILLAPRAGDFGNQTETRGNVLDAFDIQLIDGIAPADPAPGVGIDDSSVNSSVILLTEDGRTLVEGVDYRFGYDASNNIIRLTPIAGIWKDNSTYVVRLLDASDSVLLFGPGADLADGAVTTLLTTTGQLVDFEAESGVRVDVDTLAVVGGFDGQVLTIFNGIVAVNFEINTNLVVSATSIPVTVAATASATQVAAALALAINAAGINVTANSSGAALQLLGTSPLVTASSPTPAATIFAVSGAIGTRVGFGIQIPADGAAVSATVADGQTFVIRRGATLVRTFEIDFSGGVSTPGAIAITTGVNPTLDQLADAIVRAVGGAGLGLAPTNAGAGRVVLGGDANYSLDVSTTVLTQLGRAGQGPSVAVPVPVGGTAEQVAIAYAAAITGANLPGVSASVVGERVILNGVSAVSGVNALPLPIIRDEVGNLLQSSGTNGRTELTIFVGGGSDYGDAPAPYLSLDAAGGPRHIVDRGLTLGEIISPDADARLNDGDDDDGVALVGSAASGFQANFTVDVRSDGRAFFLDAWVDWNRDGVFAASEVTRFRSANSPGTLPIVGAGVNTITINVPAGVTNGSTFARFRLSEVSGLGPNGLAASGEVEDLQILVQSNPFQNPIDSTDVNRSGATTPVDALNIINLIAQFNRNGGSGTSIPLNPVPPFMTDILNGRFLPDTNGDGFVRINDALRVINEIEDRRRASRTNRPSGEGEGFVALSNGLLASPLTAATEPGFAQDRSEELLPVAAVQAIATPAVIAKTSVFDLPQLAAMDDVIADLAGEDRPAASGNQSSAVDLVFSGLGAGL